MAIKTYNHAVIYNGTFYPANSPIEVEEVKTTEPIKIPEKSPKKSTKKAGVKHDNGTD